MRKPKVLFVMTSHAQLGRTGLKTGVWFEEVTTPYYLFLQAGYDVTLSSVKGGEVPIDPASVSTDWDTKDNQKFRQDPAAMAAFKQSIDIDFVKAKDYDQIYFPGGHGPMWDFVGNVHIQRLLKHFLDNDKPVGSLCHGVAALINLAELNGKNYLKGKKLTAFANSEEKAMNTDEVMPFLLETRLRELEAKYSQGQDFASHVVTDGKLVTGQNPASSFALAKAMLELE